MRFTEVQSEKEMGLDRAPIEFWKLVFLTPPSLTCIGASRKLDIWSCPLGWVGGDNTDHFSRHRMEACRLLEYQPHLLQGRLLQVLKDDDRESSSDGFLFPTYSGKKGLSDNRGSRKQNSPSTDDSKAPHYKGRIKMVKICFKVLSPPGQSFLQVENWGSLKKEKQSVTLGSRTLWQSGPPSSNELSQVWIARLRS